MRRTILLALGLALVLTAPGPAAAQGQQVVMPDAEKIVLLIRNSLITLNDALRTGNYTVLRDMGAPGFREANTAAQLSRLFSDLAAKGIDPQGLFPGKPGADRLRVALSGGERTVAPVRYFGAARRARRRTDEFGGDHRDDLGQQEEVARRQV